MKKSIKWILNNWFIALIIAMLFGLAVLILLELVGCIKFFGREKEASAGDLLHSLILCIGAIGGVYGLHLAAKRQKTFSDQVQGQSRQVQLLSEQVREQAKQVQVQSKQMQVEADQSFNDRLGRGVELLAKDDVVMRCAGIQILSDLVKNVSERQKPIVARAIYNFFCDKARVKYDSHGNQYARCEEDKIQDLQDALEFLVNLPLNLRKKLRVNPKNQLDFSFLDFSYLIIKCEKLKQVDFSNSCFVKTKYSIGELEISTFKDTNFMDVNFEDVQFMNVSFTEVNFTGGVFNRVYFRESNFWRVFFKQILFREVDFVDDLFRHTRFENVDFMIGEFDNVKFKESIFMCATFSGVDIDGVDFVDVNIDDVEITDTKFREVYFLKGCFYSDEEINISSHLSFPYFVGTDVGVTDFTFDAGIKISDFFQLCYCNQNKWSSGTHNPINKTRRYKKGAHGHDIFVKSTKNWSEQPVQKWVAVEYAHRKLEWVEFTSPSQDSGKVTIAEVELETAISILRTHQEQYGLPKKMPKLGKTTLFIPIDET